jgi:hypothetical protein
MYVNLGSVPANTTIELHNYLGQVIVSEKAAGGLVKIDYKNAANGMYLLKVISGDKCIFVTKVVKE